ncbi:hypothetical protein LXL04_022511 [Taraxacum kok-saghyz]
MQKPKVKKMMRRTDGSRTGASDDVYRVFLQEEALHANDIPGNINIDEEFVRNFDILDGFGVEESIPMNENRSQEPKSDSDYEGDHEDSNFFIDEDNIIEDVEVDMEDFYMNIDTGAETNELSNEAEDIEVIDNDEFDSLSDDSRDTRRRKLLNELGKQKVCSEGEVHNVAFHIGQKYRTKKELKDKVDMHALKTKKSIFFKKNDKSRLTAVCTGTVIGNASGIQCPWRLHASRSTVEEYCPVRALQDQLVKKYDVHISEDKVFRAKAVATKVVEGDYTKQYAILRDYVLEIQKTNPGTTVKIEVVSEPNPYSSTRQFKRIYVCLGALKKGFKAGIRDFLGLDGAFMKGPFPGQILTAVGVDSNNGIYPLAYAVVESENTSSWKWFLECLGEDLELYSNSNFTFVTDRQNGLDRAIGDLFPHAEHRYCVRHIYQNMRREWKATEYKDFLWKCAKATTIPEFEAIMKDLSIFDKEAYEWAISDMLLNNLCEVFNSKLVKGRDKPIISCLEFIREYLMKRVVNVMKVLRKSAGPLTPTGNRLLEANSSLASQYRATWNGGQKYQVEGFQNDQHVVDMGSRECTCRKWELTGIPCKHAIATLFEMAKYGEHVGELYTYVHKVYWLDTWKEMYSFKVEPIKGRAMWPKSDCPITLLPPPHYNTPGRPKEKEKDYS